MDLRKLEIFTRVATLGSFSQAANSLHMAQPAVSIAVRKLEDSLGVPLLDRSGRRIALTKEGENLLMMAAMDGFKRLFAERALPLRWLRNTGMRLVGRAGPVKQQLMRHAMGIR